MTLRAVTLLAMIERGIQLRRAGHPRLAIGCYQRVIDQDRSDATAWTCLGNALKDVGRIAEAIAAQRQAASLAPGNAAVQLNLAIALRHAEAWHEALAVLDRAAALAPDDAAVAWERALILLQLGHYAAGLTEYEARFALPNGPTLPPGLRVWAGEDPADRTITLLPEQGFGDTFLAMRFVASLQARGARVVLQARAETLRLLATDPSITIFALDQPSPQSDMICPMMSLPRHLATVSTAIPPPWRPRPDSQAQAKAAMLVPRRAGTMQVGICWAGSDGFADNRRRSVPLDALLSLLELPDVSLFSLQKGRADPLVDRVCPPPAGPLRRPAAAGRPPVTHCLRCRRSGVGPGRGPGSGPGPASTRVSAAP